jgi:hypothetical protein
MSTQPRITQFIRNGPDEFVGRSDIIDDNGKPAVMDATYRRHDRQNKDPIRQNRMGS